MQSEKGAIFYLKKKKWSSWKFFAVHVVEAFFNVWESRQKVFNIQGWGLTHSHARTHAHKHTQRALMPHITPLRSDRVIFMWPCWRRWHHRTFRTLTSLYARTHARTHVYLWLQRTFTVTSLSLYQLTLTVTTACLTFWGTAFVSMERLSQLFFPVIFVSLIYRRLSEFSLS